MMRTIWLSTLMLKIDGASLYLDCYGTEALGVWLICSESFNCVTKVIESWSYANETN